MSTNNVAVAGLLSLIFLLLTQVIKSNKPEEFEKYSKYVTFSLILLGIFLNLTYFLANNTPIVADNMFRVIYVFTEQIVLGAIAGAAATGLYEVSNNNELLNDKFKSVKVVLKEKAAKAKKAAKTAKKVEG